MARYSSPQMAKVLERLELERPQIVTIGDLAKISAEEGVATSAAVLAARMRERGWLLPFQRKLYAGREGRFSLDLDFAELVEGAGASSSWRPMDFPSGLSDTAWQCCAMAPPRWSR